MTPGLRFAAETGDSAVISKRSRQLPMPDTRPSFAIVTCIRNEGADLFEWLCFHRHVGATRFVIYDNQSSDATQRILAAVPFAHEISVHAISNAWPQKAAFNDALKRYRQTLDWVAFLDGDEFIVPLGVTSLVPKLSELESAGVDGLGIHWRIFGSSGHEMRPEGLVTESFTRRAADVHKANRHVKSIVRIGRVREMVTPHYFRMEGKYLDDGAEPNADFEGVSAKASYSQGFAIHHYITKSREQCLTKIARGRPKPRWSSSKFRAPTYFESHDRNDIQDRRAAEVIAPIREEVLQLRDSIGRD